MEACRKRNIHLQWKRQIWVIRILFANFRTENDFLERISEKRSTYSEEIGRQNLFHFPRYPIRCCAGERCEAHRLYMITKTDFLDKFANISIGAKENCFQAVINHWSSKDFLWYLGKCFRLCWMFQWAQNTASSLAPWNYHFRFCWKKNVLAAVNHELKREFHSVFSCVVFGTIKCALWAKFSYHTLHKCRIRIMKTNGME